MPACHKCTHELSTTSDYGRQDTCVKCHSATHCCLNCLHFDRSKYNECAEPSADRVVDKEKANFCDYFKPGSPKSGMSDARQKALEAAQALFKKKP